MCADYCSLALVTFFARKLFSFPALSYMTELVFLIPVISGVYIIVPRYKSTLRVLKRIGLNRVFKFSNITLKEKFNRSD